MLHGERPTQMSPNGSKELSDSHPSLEDLDTPDPSKELSELSIKMPLQSNSLPTLQLLRSQQMRWMTSSVKMIMLNKLLTPKRSQWK